MLSAPTGGAGGQPLPSSPSSSGGDCNCKLVFDFNLLFTLLDDTSFITAGEMADLYLLCKSNSTLDDRFLQLISTEEEVDRLRQQVHSMVTW